MSKKNSKVNFYDVYKTIRKDWNNTKPYTRIEKDKTKYTRKEKHKQRYDY